MGSITIEDVRNYVADELRDLGLEPELQTLTAPDYYRDSGTVAVVDVMARIPGTAPTGAVVLVAHIDTVPETQGANDNASGVAVTLETARNLLAGRPLRNDVILLFPDGEEPAPRYGSTAFVDDHPWFDDARFIVNLEAIGTGGPSMLIETNGPQSWVLDRLIDSAPRPVAFSFLTAATALIGGSNTDLAPFRDAGVPGVEFVYARGSSIYHTGRDTPDSASRRSLNSHGVNTLGLVRQLAAEDLAMNGGRDMVFFTVGRFNMVRYPTSWGVPIVVFAGALLFAAVRRRRIWSAMVRVDSGDRHLLPVRATAAGQPRLRDPAYRCDPRAADRSRDPVSARLPAANGTAPQIASDALMPAWTARLVSRSEASASSRGDPVPWRSRRRAATNAFGLTAPSCAAASSADQSTPLRPKVAAATPRTLRRRRWRPPWCRLATNHSSWSSTKRPDWVPW